MGKIIVKPKSGLSYKGWELYLAQRSVGHGEGWWIRHMKTGELHGAWDTPQEAMDYIDRRKTGRRPKPKFKPGQRVMYAGHPARVSTWSGGTQYDDYGQTYRYKIQPLDPEGAGWTQLHAGEESLKAMAKQINKLLKK